MYTGQPQKPAKPCSHYHKRGHPAKVMAEDSLSKQDGGNKNQADNSVVNYIALDRDSRDTILRFKEKINCSNPSGVEIAARDSGEPNTPYDKFYKIPPALSGSLSFIAEAHSCNPPAGQRYEQNNLPKGIESRNSKENTIKLPLMIPFNPALIIKAGLK